MDKWSNAAALGYAIEAMENSGMTVEQIERVVFNMTNAMDYMTIEQAKRVYEGSQY